MGRILRDRSGTLDRTAFEILVYRYDDAGTFEKEDRSIADDPDYGRVASQMPYREGTIVYGLFREA